MSHAVGDLVSTLWQTDNRHSDTLCGRVVAAGPRCFTVEWESGTRNRLPQSTHHVKPITDRELAAEALRSLGVA